MSSSMDCQDQEITPKEAPMCSSESTDLGDINTPENKCINAEIPYLPVNFGPVVHLVKLPNFLSIEPRPFDPETYMDEIGEEELTDEEGRKRLKLKVNNTIRWREVKDTNGNTVRESNTRIVKWSDGSQTLHLGKEIFDVYQLPLQGENTHLFVRLGNCLNANTEFRTKFIFRPHSTDSSTHQRITKSMVNQTQRTSLSRIVTQVGRDPTINKQSLLKLEREKLRHGGREFVQPKLKKRRPPGFENVQEEASGTSSLAGIAEESGSDIEECGIGEKRRDAIDRAKSRKALVDSDESD